MNAAIKILIKDLDEFRRRPNLLFWLLASSLAFFWISGNLKTHDSPFRVLLSVPSHTVRDDERDQVELLLREFADVTVVEAQPNLDIGADARVAEADIVVARPGRVGKPNDASEAHVSWVVVNAERPGPRQKEVEALAYKIALSIRMNMPWQAVLAGMLYVDSGKVDDDAEPPVAPPPPPSLPGTPVTTTAIPPPVVSTDLPAPVQSVGLAKALEVPVFTLYGGATRGDLWLVPAFLALLIQFVPFLLACNTFAREREFGTLEQLLLTSGLSWHFFAIGKSLFPILSGFVLSCVLLIFAESWFDLAIRSTVLEILGVQLVGVLVATCLGLLFAGLVQSQQQAYFAAAAYLLASILLSGLIIPSQDASGFIRLLSLALPLTWTYEPLANWMLTGAAMPQIVDALIRLAIQLLICAAMVWSSLNWTRQRI